MANIRYQVFISSTYSDLQAERLAVSDSIMKMDCIPVGMELFPAIDEDQLEFIKTVIDDSDYYVLIIGGRYGSINNDGVSYTEREYDYALEKGIPILSFIHSEPESIQVGKTDNDATKALKLKDFVERAKNGRLVKGWRTHLELSLAVTQSLLSQIRVKPGVGWVRGDAAASIDILTEINELRKANAEIIKENLALKNTNDAEIPNLAPLNQKYKFRADVAERASSNYIVEFELSWSKIFAIIGPSFMTTKGTSSLGITLNEHIIVNSDKRYSSVSIRQEYLETILIQLLAYRYLTRVGADGGRLRLSELGIRVLFELKAARAAQA